MPERKTSKGSSSILFAEIELPKGSAVGAHVLVHATVSRHESEVHEKDEPTNEILVDRRIDGGIVDVSLATNETSLMLCKDCSRPRCRE